MCFVMTKLRVRDLMTTEVATLQPTDTIRRAAIKLGVENVSGAPVVDKKNHLLGFVSEVEILKTIDRYQRVLDKESEGRSLLDFSMDSTADSDETMKKIMDEISDTEISALMIRSVMITSPDAPIMEVMRIMVKSGFNRIPVLEKGVLVGIISRGDITFALYKKKA